MPEERPYRSERRRSAAHPTKKSSLAGLQVIVVQSLSCVVVIAIVLLLKVLGGSAYEQLRKSFNESMMDNTFAAALAALFNEEDGGKGTPPSGTTTAPSAAATKPAGAVSVAGTTTGTGTGTGTATTVTGSTKTGTTAAIGGLEIPVDQPRVLYAPDGASFGKLQINRLAHMPLTTGKVTSYFGYRKNPTKEGDGFHMGMDIGAPAGSPIAALYFGEVRETGESATYGNYIRMYHGGGMEVLYAHCSEIVAQKGAVIKPGEIVAKVGSTGDSSGNHLHIEVRVNGTAFDPAYIVPLSAYA